MQAYIQDFPEWYSTAIDRLKEIQPWFYNSWYELNNLICEIVKDDIGYYDRFWTTNLLHWGMYPHHNLHWLLFITDKDKRLGWVCDIYLYARYDHQEQKPYLISVSEIKIY